MRGEIEAALIKENLVSLWCETEFRTRDVSRAKRGISTYQALSAEILPRFARQDTSLALSRQRLVIGGVDEVGRGCLAGPVYAACTVLDYAKLAQLPASKLSLIRDSKTLSASQRQRIRPVIEEICQTWAIGKATVSEIERFGILQATFLAMRRALKTCDFDLDVLLIDGRIPLAGYEGRQETVVKGDNLCFSIAAASILAKEARDTFMHKQAKAFPAYGFDRHVGYATPLHLAMLKEHGITPLHRRNFAPVSEYAQVDNSK